MDEYPEELRTPPVSLVSLVGCPDIHQKISAALHAEQPPINTLALPDFSKISVLASRQRDPLDLGAGQQPPAGILKRDWLAKHRTRVPAVVAALFTSDQVRGDPAQWLQVCTDLENLKVVVHGRNTRLVVILLQRSVRDDVNEDLLLALKKRAEIDSNNLITFCESNASELRQSLNRLAGLFADLCNTYYREEGRKIKYCIEKKTYSYAELHIRYCFKVAVFAEFRRDWTEASRFYEDAYSALHEMIGMSRRLPPIQRLVEIKAVAEQLHFKISTLLLHGGKVFEAIEWFHKHISSYERLIGEQVVIFLHWEWFSRQFLAFAELLGMSSASISSSISNLGTNDSPLTEWQLQPAYYSLLSAKYLRKKKHCLTQSFSTEECSELVNTIKDTPVVPAIFVGQFARLYEEGETVTVLPLSDAEYTRYALAEGQRFLDSYEIIELFQETLESFKSLKSQRTASYCGSQMAQEYFAAEDFVNAKQIFDGIAALYRQEGWVTLLWEALGYLRECSRNVGSLKNFVEYSLEMAALPIISNARLDNPEDKTEFGPAGQATLLKRETIQEEVFGLLKGQLTEAFNDELFSPKLLQNQPLCLEIDLISSLRVVLLASVAFHEQSIKPGVTTLFTLSLLSQLPLPIDLDGLEIQFNQSPCNFRVIHGRDGLASCVDSQAVRIETSPLTLTTNRWLRLRYEIESGQSGKLECLFVTAKVGPHFSICCRAESPASMEDLPLWKFEDRVETFPTKDPGLSFSSQKFIQIEEPEPLVDLILGASGPALVGENFIVPVTVTSKGHIVNSGELKINLVDARGGGMLMSPREHESFASDSHHVELLSISGLSEENESDTNFDGIKKIQQSFGVVSVPTLGAGDSWSCSLEIKWHRSKLVMLYVSLGYSLDTNDGAAALQRVNVHRSLQIEGKIPFVISHSFMTPYRREPLFPSKLKSIGDPDLALLPLGEKTILIVSAKNCTDLPLRITSLSIEQDDDEDAKIHCSVQQKSWDSSDAALVGPNEEFKQAFLVKAEADSRRLAIGMACIKWARDSKVGRSSDFGFTTKHKMPYVDVEKPPLVVSLECPSHAVLGAPFSFYVRVHNLTQLLQEIKYTLGDSQSFVFAGPHNDSVSILPEMEHIISYKAVPLSSGSQYLPRINITSIRYSAALQPSIAATYIFVFPSRPNLNSAAKTSKDLNAVISSE